MRILSCAAALLVLFNTLAVPAFAEEEVWILDPEEPPVVISEDGSQTQLSSETPADLLADPSADTTVSEMSPDDPDTGDDEETAAITFSVLSIADLDEAETGVSGSGEEASMRDVIVQVFGEYSPRTQTVTQYLSDGSLLGTTTEIVPGVAGMDWSWISGVLLFALVLASFLKLVGVLLKHG